MIDHLLTKTIVAIEALANCQNNNDLKLLGISPLKNYSTPLKQAIEANDLNDSNLFLSVFGPYKNFIYVIESSCNDCINFHERGLGYVYQSNDSTYLKRLVAFSNGSNSSDQHALPDGLPFPIKCYDFPTLVYSSIPNSISECLIVENSVLTSSTSCLPNPIQLQKDSFLARFDENIQSISFDDTRLIDKIINLVSKFTKQLKLQTSKLTTKRVETAIVDIIPSNDHKAKKGSLCYDETLNCLKFYDGNSWKILQHKDSL